MGNCALCFSDGADGADEEFHVFSRFQGTPSLFEDPANPQSTFFGAKSDKSDPNCITRSVYKKKFSLSEADKDLSYVLSTTTK